MSKFISLYILFIINFLLINQKLCGSNEIEHFIECDNEQWICTKCENKYFVLYAGLRCNHPKNGQPTFDGNCDNSIDSMNLIEFYLIIL